MREKTRFAVVAIAAATAGAAITTLIDRLALRQDLEFLGIVHQQVQEGVEDFRKKVEGDTNAEEGEQPPGS